MYLSPDGRDSQAGDTERNLIQDFNKQLVQMRNDFVKAHDDVVAYVFDVENFLTKVLEDPTIFPETAHLRNTTQNCWDYNP